MAASTRPDEENGRRKDQRDGLTRRRGPVQAQVAADTLLDQQLRRVREDLKGPRPYILAVLPNDLGATDLPVRQNKNQHDGNARDTGEKQSGATGALPIFDVDVNDRSRGRKQPASPERRRKKRRECDRCKSKVSALLRQAPRNRDRHKDCSAGPKRLTGREPGHGRMGYR